MKCLYSACAHWTVSCVHNGQSVICKRGGGLFKIISSLVWAPHTASLSLYARTLAHNEIIDNWYPLKGISLQYRGKNTRGSTQPGILRPKTLWMIQRSNQNNDRPQMDKRQIIEALMCTSTGKLTWLLWGQPAPSVLIRLSNSKFILIDFKLQFLEGLNKHERFNIMRRSSNSRVGYNLYTINPKNVLFLLIDYAITLSCLKFRWSSLCVSKKTKQRALYKGSAISSWGKYIGLKKIENDMLGPFKIINTVTLANAKTKFIVKIDQIKLYTKIQGQRRGAGSRHKEIP